MCAQHDQVRACFLGGFDDLRSGVAARHFGGGAQSGGAQGVEMFLEVFAGVLLLDVEQGGGGDGQQASRRGLFARQGPEGGDDAQEI